ncbi:MAG: ABC transporter substrate-binding protein [Burkholderiaceae bacterium]|nr:ABC transporter substrate-binding protein [Burkholderiaceae bacterium]
MKRQLLRILIPAMLLGCAAGAHAQGQVSNNIVKIGVLTDMSGVYADLAGAGSVRAADMAIEDFSKNRSILGKKIELTFSDSQNKPDIASARARTWFDTENVDVIVDLPATNVALAVMHVAEQANKITLLSSPGSQSLTDEHCNANNVHWMYDTYALSVGTANALSQSGGKTWFYITADYAFGAALENDSKAVVLANGGKVVGSARVPFPNVSGDFSSYLLSAQASNAEVIALALAGVDMMNAVRQAAEFQVASGGRIVAPLLITISDVHGLGLEAAQGLQLTSGFYWAQDAEAEAWSRRFFEKEKRMPTMIQAGVYSAVLNYLRAVEAAGTDETSAVMKQLKSMPINDPVIRDGRIRANGRLVHDMMLVQVKAPAESVKPWDYFTVKERIPGEKAFQPVSASKCPLLKQSNRE